jgi:alanyl-tRNA synthetase
VRQTFIDYFTERDHVFVPSSPVVPYDDPSLLFTNAGMNQFKPLFLGRVDPSSPLYGLRRACNTQKCVRAGGKHNDLDDVGRDTYHHTFFEMLGNWSFGDYFNVEAIQWAWDLLTRVFGLAPDQLYVTYFGGDPGSQLPPDLDTRDQWLRYLPPERVLPFGTKDNFWEMGETGPCGPSTEIHYDRVPGRLPSQGAALVNVGDESLIEIWNLVLIQFNRESDGSLRRLPALHVDTGMGLERLCAILQGKRSNYDTDLFIPLFAAIQRETRATEAYAGRLGAADGTLTDTAYRVVADHIRTLAFAIADGAVPSNDGRGYVLRRILRRAVRYGQQFLDAPRGFLHRLVPDLVALYRDVFPEIESKADTLTRIIFEEEMTFSMTLKRGLDRFHETASALVATGEHVFPGKDAFFLYDSMGFPLDLTQILATERGLTVDVAAYEAEMARQRAQSAAAHRQRLGAAEALVLGPEPLSILSEQWKIPPTDDSFKYQWYEALECMVLAIYTGPSGFTPEIETSEERCVGVILDRTPFYAEAGGQVADTGHLGERFRVINVQSFGGYVMHVGFGRLRVGERLVAQVDYERRALVAPNHTATHILNWAIWQVLGQPCDQKGSLVDEQKLRFDFAFSRGLRASELERVEQLCREIIARNLLVYTQQAPLSTAKQVRALRAVFGETYPNEVRVVSIGMPVDNLLAAPQHADWDQFSIELCGGTHLRRTGEAHAFCLVDEGAIAKGIRRVVARTGVSAVESMALARGLASRLPPIPPTAVVDGAEKADSTGSPSPIAVPTVDGLASVAEALKAVTISAAEKERLRERLDYWERIARKQAKQAVAAREQALVETLVQMVADARRQRNATETRPVLGVAAAIDLNGDRRLLLGLLQSALKRLDADIKALWIASPEPNGHCLVGCVASDWALQHGLDCTHWLNRVLAPRQGRGGGKADSARGSCQLAISNSHASQESAVMDGAKSVERRPARQAGKDSLAPEPIGGGVDEKNVHIVEQDGNNLDKTHPPAPEPIGGGVDEKKLIMVVHDSIKLDKSQTMALASLLAEALQVLNHVLDSALEPLQDADTIGP